MEASAACIIMGNQLSPGKIIQCGSDTAHIAGYTYEPTVADLGSLGKLEGTLIDKRPVQ